MEPKCLRRVVFEMLTVCGGLRGGPPDQGADPWDAFLGYFGTKIEPKNQPQNEAMFGMTFRTFLEAKRIQNDHI